MLFSFVRSSSFIDMYANTILFLKTVQDHVWKCRQALDTIRAGYRIKKRDLGRSLLSSTQVVWNCSTVDKCGIGNGRGWQPLHKRVDFQAAHWNHREPDTKLFNPSCEVEFELRFLDGFAAVDTPLFRLAPNRHESFVWFTRQVSHRGLPKERIKGDKELIRCCPNSVSQ